MNCGTRSFIGLVAINNNKIRVTQSREFRNTLTMILPVCFTVSSVLAKQN